MDNFDLKKYLVENKLTKSSLLDENIKLNNFKELLNKFHNDQMVSLEDLGKVFKKLNSEDHEEAFKEIENSESDYILDDNEFYAFAGYPVR